ncbi:MAG: TonB-dependent receptor [Bacteroidetes bacterium]|nr:TonB-dependent receptor [Bacteroidota bacterium]
MRIKLLFSLMLLTSVSFAQGVLNGTVNDAYSGKELQGISFELKNTAYKTVSDARGKFTFENVPSGNYTLVYVAGENMNYEQYETDVKVETGRERIVDVNLTPKTYKLDDIYVFGATKTFEKVTESPSAVHVLYRDKLNSLSRCNQIAGALTGLSGVDVLRNGSTDYIVNTRGFNSGLNRRLLVLQDGRDVAMPLLGAIEWNSFAYPLDEFSKVEFVKGPSASLYGANAFNGVLNLTSFSPREVLGTKISLLGGDYKTLRADVRNAGMITNKLSYKVTLGRSQSYNLAHRRDSAQYLEYSGLQVEARPIKDDERTTYSNYGTLRFDYDINNKNKIDIEGGYSNNTNEAFVFGLGRTFVKNTERPYVQAQFSSDNIYFHAHYMKRHTLDTMWLLLPRNGNKLGSPLLDNSDDILLDAQYNKLLGKSENTQVIFGMSQQFQNVRTSGTSIPNDVYANYTGVYGQFSHKFSGFIKFVGTARFDRTNIHEAQFSPRAAFVISPVKEHQFRISVSRSFQRPNYSDLYRLTPDAPAFATAPGPPKPALLGINKIVADSIKVLGGYSSSPNINLNLDGTRAYAVGNSGLNVEKNLGFEFGYNGNFNNRFFVNVDFYYNILSDFITNFLPSVNKNFTSWQANLPDSLARWNSLATSIVYSQLSARDRQRLSYFNGMPAFVVSNTNIGTVKQYGVDVTLSYYINRNIYLTGNYSRYDYNIDKNPGDPDILPNTSPNKAGMSVTYQLQNKFDATLSFLYSDRFDWLAGTYAGVVPAYKIFNFNAGYYILKNLQLGAYVYNIFDEQHYEMFGGTFMPRNFSIKASFTL